MGEKAYSVNRGENGNVTTCALLGLLKMRDRKMLEQTVGVHKVKVKRYRYCK